MNMANSIYWLNYCLKYCNNFPCDKITARYFVEGKLAEKAKDYAETHEHLKAIEMCQIKALEIYMG